MTSSNQADEQFDRWIDSLDRDFELTVNQIVLMREAWDERARLSSPSVPEGELLERINRHIGQLSPHIKERETAQLLIAAYEALLVGELPRDLPSRFHAVWNDGFREYTKEQLAWVFFQKGAESMLAHPPEAGKVQDDEALLAEYTDIRKKLLWGATTTTSEFDIFKAGYKYAMESVTGVGPASTTGAPSCRETQVRSLPDSAPSPVAQGAGVDDKRDAERYRWLRRYPTHFAHEIWGRYGAGLRLDMVFVNTPERLDAVIDAVIAPSPLAQAVQKASGNVPAPPKPTAPDGGGL
jgi:hypothetical protein